MPTRHANPAISAAPGHVPHHASPFCSPSISDLPGPAPQAPQCTSRNARLPLANCCPGGGLSCLTASVTPVDSACGRPPVRVFGTYGRDDPGLARGSHDASVISPSLSAGNYALFGARQRPPQPARSPPGRYSAQPARPDLLPRKHFRMDPAFCVVAASLLRLRSARCFFQISMCTILSLRASWPGQSVSDCDVK